MEKGRIRHSQTKIKEGRGGGGSVNESASDPPPPPPNTHNLSFF